MEEAAKINQDKVKELVKVLKFYRTRDKANGWDTWLLAHDAILQVEE